MYLFQLYQRLSNCTQRKIVTFLYKRVFSSFGLGSFIIPPFSLTGGKCVSVGMRCLFRKNTSISAWTNYHGQTFTPKVCIGDGTVLGENTYITCINQVVIGDNVLMGREVTITDNSHGKNAKDELNVPPRERHLYSKGPVKIGNNVWIGDKVTILPGVSIGDNCIIGANSVVTKDMPVNSVCAGNPCQVLKIIC